MISTVLILTMFSYKNNWSAFGIYFELNRVCYSRLLKVITYSHLISGLLFDCCCACSTAAENVLYSVQYIAVSISCPFFSCATFHYCNNGASSTIV